MPTSIRKERVFVSSSPVFASSISPRSGASASGGAVTVTDLSHLTKLVVKTTPARPDGLAPPFGTSATAGEALICGSRPGEWTVIGSTDACRDAVGSPSATSAHVVDVTHGRVLLAVAGTAATSTLEKVCSLDWSDAMMPDGAVTSASVAKVTCDVVRHDGDTPTYWISADRSFGQYLHDALLDASAEFA